MPLPAWSNGSMAGYGPVSSIPAAAPADFSISHYHFAIIESSEIPTIMGTNMLPSWHREQENCLTGHCSSLLTIDRVTSGGNGQTSIAGYFLVALVRCLCVTRVGVSHHPCICAFCSMPCHQLHKINNVTSYLTHCHRMVF